MELDAEDMTQIQEHDAAVRGRGRGRLTGPPRPSPAMR